MTESGAFLRALRDYRKVRNTEEGKELLKALDTQVEDEMTIPAFDETFINQMQMKEKMGLVEPRIYFDTIYPYCGKKNPFTVADNPMTIMGCLSMKAKCSCGRLYPIVEHIVKETPWAALGCFAFIVLSIITTILFLII